MGGADLEPGLRIIGLLGGIGSGKSTAARELAAVLPGAEVLDADALVAAELARPGALEALEEAAGAPLRGPGGGLDRRLLAAAIFADPLRRRRVESLLHPAVRRALHGRLEEMEQAGGARFAVLDVPLLLENGLDAACDFLVFLEAPPGLRAARAGARHGWSEAEWSAREAAQRPLEEKRAAAGAILDNAKGLERLRVRIRALAPRLVRLPSRPLRDRWPRWDQPPMRQRR